MTRKQKYIYKLVKIEWKDAESSHGWESEEELDTSIPLVTTIGFLVREGEESVIIASTLDPTNRHTNARIKIPKGMITTITDL